MYSFVRGDHRRKSFRSFINLTPEINAGTASRVEMADFKLPALPLVAWNSMKRRSSFIGIDKIVTEYY